MVSCRLFIAISSLILLLYFSALAAPIALGQHVAPPAVAPRPPIAPRPLIAPRPSICDEHHWILSVRHCPKTCDPCSVANCRFGVNVVDWGGHAWASNEDAFHSWLRPGVPIVIYVHGSFVPKDTVVIDSTETFRWLRQAAPQRKVQMISFTWKSGGVFTLDPAVAVSSLVPGIDVAILGKRAEVNGVRLAKLILSLPKESPVCVIGHSHGARILASALDLLGGGHRCGVQLCRGPSGRRVRGIFAAAAMDHDWMNPGERFGRAMYGAECILNMQTRLDWALAVYPLRKPFSPRALGQSGFTSRDIRKLGCFADRIAQVDVTDTVRTGHIWPRYTERPEFAQMLLPWLYYTSFE
jgi:hypothetical protein